MSARVQVFVKTQHCPSPMGEQHNVQQQGSTLFTKKAANCPVRNQQTVAVFCSFLL